MKLSELIAQLSQLEEWNGGDCEVYMHVKSIYAIQPVVGGQVISIGYNPEYKIVTLRDTEKELNF